MTDALLDKRGKSTSTIVALFTEGFRTPFTTGWAKGEPSLRTVFERIEFLLTGPVGHVDTVLYSHVEVSVARRSANGDQFYSEP